eukprot:6985917-Prymnesium_polylepis.2
MLRVLPWSRRCGDESRSHAAQEVRKVGGVSSSATGVLSYHRQTCQRRSNPTLSKQMPSHMAGCGLGFDPKRPTFGPVPAIELLLPAPLRTTLQHESPPLGQRSIVCEARPPAATGGYTFGPS